MSRLSISKIIKYIVLIAVVLWGIGFYENNFSDNQDNTPNSPTSTIQYQNDPNQNTNASQPGFELSHSIKVNIDTGIDELSNLL